MNLTPKQEKFAQCVADGMTQADAYRAAFNVKPTTKPETEWQAASKLMADSKVRARVNELKESLRNKALWTREMSVKALIEAYKIGRQGGQSGAMTGAIKELNAMHGYNAPVKHELTADIKVTPGMLTDEDLLRIAANGHIPS